MSRYDNYRKGRFLGFFVVSGGVMLVALLLTRRRFFSFFSRFAFSRECLLTVLLLGAV